MLIPHDARFNSAFRELNLAWIEEHFKIEPKDLEQVNHPDHCLESGGQIFFVVEGEAGSEEAVGTCALYRISPTAFELAKMAVRPDRRGRGYGDQLMRAAEDWAASQGAEEIVILSNTVLAPAIRLYQKHGFRTTHLGLHPDYARCNIEMRKSLPTTRKNHAKN